MRNEQIVETVKEVLKDTEVLEPILQEIERRTGRRDFLKLIAGGTALFVGGKMIGNAEARVDMYPDRIEIDGIQVPTVTDLIRTATKVVAASDSADSEVDYICDGTADESEINTAISSLP